MAFRRHHRNSRTATSASVTLAAVALAGVGACYSGPINMAPRLDDIVAVDPLKRGSDIGFRVEASDPDGDALSVTWSRSEGDCSQPETGLQTLTKDMIYTVPAFETAGPFCVRAAVTDRYGATAWHKRPVRPVNQAPAILLVAEGEDIRSSGWTRIEPFSLFRWVRFDASGTTDADDEGNLEFEWALQSPSGALEPCPDSDVTDTMSICIKASEPGPLTVRLTVRDPLGETMTVTRTVVVAEDAFPCLAQTEPSLAATLIASAPEQEHTFVVLSVADDGDPFVGSPNTRKTVFRWYLGPENGPLERQESNGASYFHVPGGRFFLGNKVRVRVEIADRNLVRSDQAFSQCLDADICATGPACRQRMTWLIDYRL